MRVLIVNTSEKTGGAAITASRLKEALINNGVKAKMLVREKETDNLSVVGLAPSWHLKYNFLWERFRIWNTNGMSKEHLFDIDTGLCGTDITSLREFKEADVIHLHWVNQGFLSLNSIGRILHSGKPVVWTMHDMWPFTGICHYARECENFVNECGNCPLLKNPKPNDLSNRSLLRKERLLSQANVTFVACSRWLADQASQSHLLRGLKVTSIANPINTQTFRPRDKETARHNCRLPLDKKLILFSAYRTTMPIKGLKYLTDACKLYNEAHPEMREQIAVVAVGKDTDQIANLFPYPVYPMGYVEDENRMAAIYNACNAFVIPSLQDNLPNTVVEAMSSGVPCVGFKTGGIPQMIMHKENGYLAEAGKAEDLKRGLEWIFGDCDYNAICRNARTFAVNEYSEHNVAMHYIEVYNTLLNKFYE